MRRYLCLKFLSFLEFPTSVVFSDDFHVCGRSVNLEPSGMFSFDF